MPIIPYGVVSFAAGLSPIKRRDYLIGTLQVTPSGIGNWGISQVCAK
ncbi:MAG: hypothetical protein IM516_08430 [Pseudanabaena sp. M158S2SP1A06QC]|nr:hypothetical protein [Pseudanabaena sp. M135S2SP2A07QC]MCA6612122.1 hypothetical protein [Pseudanabaena sp. M158S2SP1A06QC]